MRPGVTGEAWGRGGRAGGRGGEAGSRGPGRAGLLVAAAVLEPGGPRSVPDLAWCPRVLPLAGWAHVGGGPHQSPRGALPAPPPTPLALLLPRWRGAGFCDHTRDPEPRPHAGCSGQAAGRLCHLHVWRPCAWPPGSQPAALLGHHPACWSASTAAGPLHPQVPLAAGRPPAQFSFSPERGGPAGDALRPGSVADRDSSPLSAPVHTETRRSPARRGRPCLTCPGVPGTAEGRPEVKAEDLRS